MKKIGMRKKPKKFDFKNTKCVCPFANHETGSFYLKEVSVVSLGSFGYYSLYKNTYGVVHLHTGTCLHYFSTELKAKIAVKKLYSKKNKQKIFAFSFTDKKQLQDYYNFVYTSANALGLGPFKKERELNATEDIPF